MTLLLFKIFKPIFKWATLVFLGVVLYNWILHGLDWTKSALNPGQAQTLSKQVRSTLQPLDTQLAQSLSEETLTPATSAWLLAVRQDQGLTAFRKAAQDLSTGQSLFAAQLLEMSRRPGLFENPEQEHSFLHSYGTFFEWTTQATTPEESRNLFLSLELATQNPDLWRVIQADPVGLLLTQMKPVTSDSFRFYRQHREWLGDALMELALSARTESTEDRLIQVESFTMEQVLGEWLQALERLQPFGEQVYRHPDFGTPGLALALSHEAIFRPAVLEFHLDPFEVLSVLFANADQFPTLGAEEWQQGREVAQELALWAQTSPTLWERAQAHPLAIRLYREVPDLAEDLLTRFGSISVSELLFSAYLNEVVPAAQAIHAFGEPAIHLLSRYAIEPRFHQNLADPDIGIRIIPMLLRFGVEGLDLVGEDRAWLDRYFDAEGRLKEDPAKWLAAIPIVGSSGIVVRNWLNGYPNSSEELGWAAVDALDGMLLMASLGTSTPVSLLKGSAKAAGKFAVTQAGKKTLANQLFLQMKRGLSASHAAGQGRSFWKIASLTEGRQWARFFHAGSAATRVAFHFGVQSLYRVGETVYRTGKSLAVSWQHLPPGLRTWTYRGLLAVGLYSTITYRNWEHFPELALQIQSWTDQVAQGLSRSLGQSLVHSLNRLLPFSWTQGSLFQIYLVYWVIALILFLPFLGTLKRLSFLRLRPIQKRFASSEHAS